MPELPEVETIKNGLAAKLEDEVVQKIETAYLGSWHLPGGIKAGSIEYSQIEQLLRQFVYGQRITGVRRRGKVLIIDLVDGYSLLFHLKMTGQLVLVESGGERFAGGHPTRSMVSDLPDASTRVSFYFKSGDVLHFNDQRKFGWIKIVPTDEVDQDKLLSRLGPEPLEAAFDLNEFIASVKKRNAPIKAVLLDQSTVAGIGNIYADEALHLARIHPKTLASKLTRPKLKKLHEAIIAVLETSLGFGGTSFTHFVNALGVKGNYLEFARVFRKQGQACSVCGSMIEKIRVAGRGTHICPKCQKL